MLINFISNFLALIGPDDGDTSRWIMMWTDEEVSGRGRRNDYFFNDDFIKNQEKRDRSRYFAQKEAHSQQRFEKALIAIFGYVYTIQCRKTKVDLKDNGSFRTLLTTFFTFRRR